MCWFVKPSPMMHFMHNVASTPELNEAYKADPKGFLDSHEAAKDLCDEDKQLLLSDDHAGILSSIAGKH
ncbi:MAG: hypothetical protein AAF192_14830 [Pseudomonadota bacterium]